MAARRPSGVAAVVARGRIRYSGGRAPRATAWTVVGERRDLAAVDLLARIHLAARRLGATVEVGEMCPELRELLELVGLRELGGELVGQAEQGKKGVSVEEGVKPRNPVPADLDDL